MIGWIVVAFFAVVAVGFSIRESGMREGKAGSYLGRMVADSQPAAGTAQALAARVNVQR